MKMELCAEATRTVRIALALAATVAALSGCKSELPAPAYPSPESRPLEETELWPYFEEQEPEEEADEAWDDEEDESWEDETEEPPAPAP